MKKYAKLFFMLAVFSFALFGAAKGSYAAKPSDYGLKDGDLISAIFSDDPDVYIVNENGYKRLFLNPEIFNFYGHLGGFFNVKLVSVETRDAFVTSGLFRNCENNDPRVFGIEVDGEDMGKARWLDSAAETVLKEDSEFFKKVFCINDKEFRWYPKGIHFKTLKDLPRYERLKEKTKISTKEKIKKDLKYYGKDDDDDDDKDEDEDDDFYEKKIKGIGKVVVCHKDKETLTVGASALKGHLKHGDKIGSCGEQTPPPASEDTTAPVISGISSTSTTSISTHIIWSTNEKSNSKVWYATSTPVVATSTTMSVQSATLVKSHNVALTGLTASTTYYYIVESSDSSGNTSTSSEYYFTTLAAPDTTAPVISGASATSTASTTASVNWITNENSNSKVWYATSTPVSIGMASSTSDANLVTNHNMILSGLSALTQYFYFAVSTDAFSNTATSSEYSITTPSQ